MKLFDAHCHLADEALASDIDSVTARAAAAGVEKITCCGTSPEDWERTLLICRSFSQLVPMVGIHPWFADGCWGKNIQQLKALLQTHPEAGIGETGLDFQDRFTHRAEQKASFAAHLDLAREMNRPVAVHCVRAWGPLLEILRTRSAPRILLHAFGGPVELIPELTTLNCWFSFCGTAANPNAKRVRAAAAAVPAERLLIETDAPDLSNEPSDLLRIARAVAKLRDTPPEELAELTFFNSNQFFSVSA